MKKTITILVVLSLLLSSIPFLMETAEATQIMTLSDAELSTQFIKDSGTGSVSITNPAGNGVQFVFTGLNSADKMIVGDKFEISALAGGALNEGHFSDFSANTQYSLVFKNIGAIDVDVDLCMNTGYTGTGHELAEDTWWEILDWTSVAVGETKTVTLSFSSAKCWNLADDPVTEWQRANGEVGPMYRLNEVTNIGFMVMGTGDASLLVSGFTRLYIDPVLVEKHYEDIGYTFDVMVKLEDFNDFFAFDIEVTWNSALISCSPSSTAQDAYLTALWGVKGTDWLLVAYSSAAGSYNLAATCMKSSGGPSSVTPVDLMKLTFTVLDPGTNSMKETSISFTRHDLSDSSPASIGHTAEDGTYKGWGITPKLDLSTHAETCRYYGESFYVGIIVSDALTIEDYTFEIHYDTTLLDYSSVTWNTWGTGSETINVDEDLGVITVGDTGSPISDTHTLLTLKFIAHYYHIWKNLPSWVNDQTGNIFLQSATLSFTSPEPNLNYVRGGIEEIDADDAQMTYTFSPIKGDMNNSGHVNILDLTSLTTYYRTTDAGLNLVDVGNTDFIDIFDVVVIGSNMWYDYPGAPPG